MNSYGIEWQPLQALRWYQRAGVLAVAVMLALSLLPLGDASAAPPNADKVLHGGGYLLLSTFFAQLLQGRRSRTVLVLMLLGFGGLVEVLQGLLPWRNAEFADLVANAVGIALGLTLTAGRGGRLLLMLERRLA